MIREADPDDIDEVYALWRELLEFHQPYHAVFRFKPGSEEVLKKELWQRLKSKESRFFCFVQEDEWQGLLVATLKQASPGFKLAKKGYIGETVVQEKHRGNGIGKKLVDAAKKWLTDNGADHIELQVSVRNKAALHFWEELGFVPTTQHLVLDISNTARKG